MSKPVSWQVGGRLLVTSRSQMPVPVAMSATLRVGDVMGILGWMRKPKVSVVKTCCSSSLLRRQLSGFSDLELKPAFLGFLLCDDTSPTSDLATPPWCLAQLWNNFRTGSGGIPARANAGLCSFNVKPALLCVEPRV